MNAFIEKLVARHKHENEIYDKFSSNRTLYLGETIKRLKSQQERIDRFEEVIRNRNDSIKSYEETIRKLITKLTDIADKRDSDLDDLRKAYGTTP